MFLVVFGTIKEVYKRLKRNPKRVPLLLRQYFYGQRSLGLDVFSVITTKVHSFDSTSARILVKLLAPGELLIRQILSSDNQKLYFGKFDYIRKRKYRMHSRHFTDSKFCDKFYAYIGTLDYPQDAFDMRSEADSIGVFHLLMRTLDLHGWVFDHSLKFREGRKVDRGILGIEEVENVAEILKTPLSTEKKIFSFQEPFVFEETSSRENRTVELPPIACFKLRDITVYSGGQVIKDDKLIVYEKSAHPIERKFIAGLYDKVYGLPASGTAYCVFEHDDEIEIESATLFYSRCPTNYFHWMIEYLPKIKTILDLGLASAPMLVPLDLYDQQREAVDYLAKRFGLQIKLVGPNCRIKVREIFIPSPVTFHPDDPEVPYWMGGGLYEEYIYFLRDNIISEMGLTTEDFPDKKIFLGRSVTLRNISNIKAIENLVKQEGFEIIFPENLTLRQQAETMSKSKVVVSPGGSALTNVIFMRPGATLISLVSDHNKYYSIYSNLAQICGVNYIQLTGPSTVTRQQAGSSLSYMHASYTINLEKLKRGIRAAVDDIRNIW